MEEMDGLKDEIRIDPCQDIIQYNPIPSRHILQVTDGRRLDDIEKAKEQETDEDEKRRLGYPQHGDEKAHDLIDDDSRIILLSPVSLGLIRNPTG